MVRITATAIDPSDVYNLISSQDAGSVVFHYAIVKPMAGVEGTTSFIDYAIGGDAMDELQAIAAELSATWSLCDVLLIRRTGRLGLGEIISLVAISSQNSDDAFTACRQGINRMKQMKTIIKQEVYA